MGERERWWERFKVQVSSVQKFVADARAEDQWEALDAFGDVLDEIRDELFEETKKRRMARRAAHRGKPLRGIHPLFRAVAAAIARRLSRMGRELEWQAAGFRARLKQGEPNG
jgi:hypothetical protein